MTTTTLTAEECRHIYTSALGDCADAGGCSLENDDLSLCKAGLLAVARAAAERERAAVVAWLRSDAPTVLVVDCLPWGTPSRGDIVRAVDEVSDAIARADHLTPTPPAGADR